jgi:hypothetical protein
MTCNVQPVSAAEVQPVSAARFRCAPATCPYVVNPASVLLADTVLAMRADSKAQ